MMSEDGTLRRACAEIDRLRSVNAELESVLREVVRITHDSKNLSSRQANRTAFSALTRIELAKTAAKFAAKVQP